MMKSAIFKCIEHIGCLVSYLWPAVIGKAFRSFCDKFYTGYIKRNFAEFGNSIFMCHAYTLVGKEYIHIGDRNIFESGIQLTARKINIEKPNISIGNNCLLRKGCHITAINNIEIGNDLLTGTNVIITDNSHGDTNFQTLHSSPRTRIAYSKKGTKIGNNVWLGNNVCVMPGVTIGDGVIVGANSVVTHDIPDYCIAAGVPAKVIKREK